MAAKEPPVKKRKLDFTEQFEVVVSKGQKTRSYTVPKNVLTKSSHFFRAACNKEWKEGQSKKIELSDTNPEHFDIYLQFLYEGQIVPTDEKVEDFKKDSHVFKAHFEPVFWGVVDTYLLAEMLMDIPSKNALMDYCLDLMKVSNKFGWAARIYEKTPEHSPFRRLCVDEICSTGNLPAVKIAIERMESQFAIDLAYKQKEHITKGTKPENPCCVAKCTYHEHDDENPPCR